MVCPHCDYHFRINARTRISQLFDEDSFEGSDDEFGEPDFDVPPPVREKSVRELMEEVKDNPMVQEAIDLFGGKLTDVYVNN